MSLRLLNKKDLLDAFPKFAINIEKALIYQLEYLVAELQNHAKASAGYQDQTSNLKGSIGGVVLKNGRPISYKGFESDGQTGNQKGLEFINSLISGFGSGYVILLVAGMEYATYVEDHHGLNVLKKSELKMNRDLPKLMEKLKLKIDKGF